MGGTWGWGDTKDMEGTRGTPGGHGDWEAHGDGGDTKDMEIGGTMGWRDIEDLEGHGGTWRLWGTWGWRDIKDMEGT